MLYITKSTMWLSFWRSVVLSHSYVFFVFWLNWKSFHCFCFCFYFQICDCDFAAQMAPMHVRHAREVPEYEIDPKEIDFTNSVEITKVLFFFFSTALFCYRKYSKNCSYFRCLLCFVNLDNLLESLNGLNHFAFKFH